MLVWRKASLLLCFLGALLGSLLPRPAAAVTLDMTGYAAFVGGGCVFLADTAAEGGVLPEAVVSDPAKAHVEYAGAGGVGRYLFRVTALAPGTATVGARTSGSLSTFPVKIVDHALIPFSPLFQNPELPAGCEVTALASVLNFYGYPVGKTDLADHFLARDDSVEVRDGKTHRANPFRVFVGDPRANQFGCFAPVIADTARKYLDSVGSPLTVRDLSGSEPAVLYDYVANGNPVLAWATMNLDEPTYLSSWYDKDTGEPIQWIGKEHCVALIGCGSTTVTIADPLRGIVSCDRTLFETRYRQVLKQAVVIQ